ncbi:MAG: hypothetical protein AB2A00_43075 [Myxococcota bacterium]
MVEADDANGVRGVSLYEEGVSSSIGHSAAPVEGTRYGIFYSLECTTPLPRDTVFRVEATDWSDNVGVATVALRLLAVPGCSRDGG